MAWAWDDPSISTDSDAMLAHHLANKDTPTLWTPDTDALRTRAVVPRMLALPPDCEAFCAEAGRTPVELFQHITETLTMSEIDP